MKVEATQAEAQFSPVTLNIVIESKEELAYIFGMFNAPTSFIRAYIPEPYKSTGTPEPKFDVSMKLWEALKKACPLKV